MDSGHSSSRQASEPNDAERLNHPFCHYVDSPREAAGSIKATFSLVKHSMKFCYKLAGEGMSPHTKLAILDLR